MQIAKFLPLALLAAGCATEEVVQPEEAVQPYLPQVNTLSTAAPQAAVAQVAYKQFILDGIAPTMVNVQEIRRSRTNDGYERVQVLVKNFTTSPMPVKYRFDWQDENGVIIDDPDHGGWERQTLIAGDDATFTSIAPKKNCADFRLRMKLAL